MLREYEVEADQALTSKLSMSSELEPIYHALLTSHHLLSKTKRRQLQKWTSGLSLRGFAKVGHPGVIYCEGKQAHVEEFVSNVKGLQWLALHVRFVEPLEVDVVASTHIQDSRDWVEFEKVGKVVEYMRNIGREAFITQMGLGNAGH